MKTRFLILATVIAVASSARGEITATVIPGYQLSPNERPTTALLNLMATPSVRITGTLGGTNVALGANTVSGTMLMDSVAGSNMTYDGSSPRRLVIANSGVNVGQIAAAVAGNGLSGGAGAALAVRVDTKTIQITNDVLTIGTNDVSTIAIASGKLVGGASTGQGTAITVGNGLTLSSGTLIVNATTVTNFVTAEYSLSSGAIANTNHGFGTVLTSARWVLICKTNDVSFTVGDEVDAQCFYESGSRPQFVTGSTSTNMFASLKSLAILVRRKDNGNEDSITAASWKLKGYARP